MLPLDKLTSNVCCILAWAKQMTYPEFLEGIARVAVLKWEDVSMPLQEKIRRALKAVTGLLDKK